MATKCTSPVTRVFDRALINDGGKQRTLTVTFYPEGTIGLRPSGTRKDREEIINAVSAYETAIRQRVASERAGTHGMVTRVKRGLL